MKNWKEYFSNLLLPKENIAGLEIKDSVLRIAKFQDNQLKKASLVLEPGIIEDGLIKNRAKFLEALQNLRDQFGSSKDKIPVIAIVPSANVYTKVFAVPLLSGENLEQAAELNLESNSPMEFQLVYADWQGVGSEEKDGKVEILGAFAQKDNINSYLGVLGAAGFLTVAVEFPALAIVRAIKKYASEIDFSSPKVAVNLSSDGIDFLVIKNGNLYFNYFVSWKLVPGEQETREIPFEDFKETLLKEIKRVVNFYGSHWGGKLDQLILLTQVLKEPISDFIKQNFNLAVTEIHPYQFPDLPLSWHSVLGSAIRGAIARSEDNFVSLMAVGTEKGYLYAQINFFFKIWRQVIFATLGFILIIFILADSFLANIANDLALQQQKLLSVSAGQEAAVLQDKAKNFNQLLDKVLIAKEQNSQWSEFFEKFNNLPKDISLSRIAADGDRLTAVLAGIAKDESAAISFKNKLIQRGFKNVSLPLSDLKTNQDGSVSFSITLSL